MNRYWHGFVEVQGKTKNKFWCEIFTIFMLYFVFDLEKEKSWLSNMNWTKLDSQFVPDEQMV